MTEMTEIKEGMLVRRRTMPDDSVWFREFPVDQYEPKRVREVNSRGGGIRIDGSNTLWHKMFFDVVQTYRKTTGRQKIAEGMLVRRVNNFQAWNIVFGDTYYEPKLVTKVNETGCKRGSICVEGSSLIWDWDQFEVVSPIEDDQYTWGPGVCQAMVDYAGAKQTNARFNMQRKIINIIYPPDGWTGFNEGTLNLADILIAKGVEL